MDVRLPNGEVIKNVPDGMSRADLVAKLRANGRDLSWLDGPSQTPAPQPVTTSPQPPTEDDSGGLVSDVGNLLKRSGARLVKGVTELPGAAAALPGKIAGSVLDLPEFALEGVTGDSPLVRDLKRRKNPAAPEAPPESTFSQEFGDATRRVAAPITESRPVVATREWAAGKEQEALAALTPMARRAIELSLVEHDEEDGLTLGEGATDPWWWTANIIDLGVQMSPGLGATAVSARMTYAAKYRQTLGELGAQKIPQSVAIKEAEKRALKAAKRAAVITGGLTEGATAGGQNAGQIRETIESLNEETLMAYPGYMEARDEGMTHEQAREQIASDKAAAVAIASGALVGMTGAPMNAYFGQLAAKFGRVAEAPSKLGRLKVAGKAAAGEGAQEFVQEAGEQYLGNKAEQPITGVDTWDGVLENAITGFVLGGALGGAIGGVGSGKKGKAPAELPPDTPAPKSPVDTAAAAFDAATAALDQAEASARDPNVKIKYAEVQKLRDAKKKALVDFTRELLHAGQIKEADQAQVSEALKQAEAEGISATSRKTPGGDISPARDAALEAAANAAMLEESDANDLISNKLAKVSPNGNLVLTPAGRRARKAAQDRAKAEADKTGTKESQPKQAVATPAAAQPIKKVITRPKMLLPPVKRAQREAKARKAFLEKQRPKTAERKIQEIRESDALKATVQAKAGEQAQTAAELAAQGISTPNPQMREAFETAAATPKVGKPPRKGVPTVYPEQDARERARRGLPPSKTVAFSMKVFPQSTLTKARHERLVNEFDAEFAKPAGTPGRKEKLRSIMKRLGENVDNLTEQRATEARSRVAFRLKGAPETADIPGKGKVKIEPVKPAKAAAAAYRAKKGITAPEQTEFVRVDPVRAKRIAKAFDEMKHEPNNPVVKRAYRAMIDETKAQWDEIKKSGLKVEFIKPGQKDPYAASPREAIEDVRKNNHLWVYPTDSGFGSDDKFAKDNPMLEDAGESIDGHKLKANDVFRIVHDYFGHVQEANGFRADGEENAWRIHASMYSPLARRAMTTETRGQNSWVNYGPKGESNRTAKAGETVYADQKIGLLPAEFSAFPGETMKFKHFSNATDDQLDLDPEKMGSGAKGAESKRGGPKVVSLYAEDGEVEPDVTSGRTRYNVEIPKEDLYNASADPQGLLAQAQVPFGLKQDDAGNMVPVGQRFDMNKFEELVRDAGYLGYHTPEASGILKGQARIFDKYPATRADLAQRKVEIAARMKRATSEEKVRGLLTPEENARLKKASAKKLIEVFDELPSGAELAASAVAGEAKRGWYRRSSEALVNVFGPDAPRFAALLAALSPQTSVEWNFRNAVAVWVGWDKVGRPTERKKIEFVMRENLFPGTHKVGKSKVLPAWVNNTVRALTAEDPTAVTLSGPKVDSFAANLRGETERVTLDAWMANWAGVDQVLFKGEMNVAGDNPGMRPGYLAFAARVREAAKILSDRTGETWTAAEVQETVWSWAKTLYEQAESYGALATAREILDNKELTDELINATPDFAGQFAEPEISSILAGTVYGPRATRSAGEAAAAGRTGRKTAPAPEDARHLRKAADRLDALRKARKEAEDETRAEGAMAVKTDTTAFRQWFGSSKVTNKNGDPLVVYHGTRAKEDFSVFKRPTHPDGREQILDSQGVNGFYFATSAEAADVFAGEGTGARIIPTYVSIKNPKYVPWNKDNQETRQQLRAKGYDGIISRRPGGNIDFVVAFDPEQIKSAVGNNGEFDPNNPNIAMRRGVSTKGIPAADLQEVAERVTRELGVTAKIADTAADLPGYIRDLIPEGAEGSVTGMFVEDQITGETEIWYVRENLDSKDEAYENALHEAVGHMGLRAVLGKSYHKVMEDIRTSFPEKVLWAARQNQIDLNHPDPATRRRLQSLATEELIAYAAGQVLAKRGALSEQSVWRKIVAKVRDILRNVGLLNSYSGEDIEALIYRARDFFRKPARTRAQELDYRGRMAMKVKEQPKGAPQWLTPDEYLSADTVRARLDAARMVPAEDDLNPAPEREGEKPRAGAVNEQVVFAPNFDNVMAGNAAFDDTEVSAYADGKKIGYVTTSGIRRDDTGWSAEYVYVDPQYRGKGVAQRMYKAISDKLGVPVVPSDNQTGLGARMWDGFKRRNVAFAMKQQIETPEFKAWFDGSKAVNADGTPKVLYHGTKDDIARFAPSRVGRGSTVFGSYNVPRFGIFMSEEPSVAEEFAVQGESPEGASIMPLYAAIFNPLDFTARHSYSDALFNSFEAEADKRGLNGYSFARWLGDHWGHWDMFDSDVGNDAAEMVAIFNALGYDGAIINEPGEGENRRTWVAFDPEQVKSAVGNRGSFDAKDPNIAFAYKQGPTGNADLDSFISKIGVKPKSLRERWNEFKHDFAEKAAMAVFDELHGIKAAEQIAGIDEKDMGYVSARLSRAAPEVVASIIENGPPVWNDGAPDVGQGMGLLSILNPLKGNVNLWLAYVAGRRASMLKGQGRENLFTQAEITAATALAQQHPEFDVARQQYNKLQKQVLDFAQEAGVIDPQTRAMWEHADYIPFYRIMQGGEVTISPKGSKGIGFVRNQIKQLKGGRDNIGDPLENIVRNWQALMDASLQAYAGRMTIDNLDGSGLVTPAKFVTNAQPIQNLNALLKANPAMANALTAAGINVANMPPAAMAGLQKMLNIAPPAGEDVVTVWRGGRKEFWHVHDPNLYQSLKNINPKLWGPWMKLFSFPKRVITKTITLTPQFMVKNFWRDMWHTFVTGAQMDRDRINMLPTESLAGLTSALANSPEYRSMVAGGGGFGESFIESGDAAGMAASVRRAINKGKTRGIILNTPVQVWRAYRHLQNAAENANRVAVYKKARAAGQTRRNSLYQARDLMDFSMRGNAEIIRLIVGMTPFFNARIQGLYRLGRGFKQAYVSVALRGLLLSAATLALLARNHDDERYKELTDQQKANYWHFFTEDGHFMLPKPFEVGTIFGTVPEAIGDAMLSDQPDATLQAAKYVGYSFGETLNLAPQPATLWPLVELAINKDTFTGTPILTQGDESVLPEDQRGPNTSATYAALAGLMPSDGPEALRSPKQLEHLGRGYIGNIQDYVLLASDALVREINGEPPPPEKATRDLPGLRDFYRTGPARNTRYQTTMYELANQAAKVQGSIKRNEDALTEEGDARVEELETENAPLLDVADDFVDAAKEVTGLKKEQRQIQLDPDMSPDEKRTQIDEIQQEINDIAKDVYDLRPGGKLNSETAAELLTAPPSARAKILRNNNMPATADLLEQVA